MEVLFLRSGSSFPVLAAVGPGASPELWPALEAIEIRGVHRRSRRGRDGYNFDSWAGPCRHGFTCKAKSSGIFPAENAERFSRVGRTEPPFSGLLPRAKIVKNEDRPFGARPTFYFLDLTPPPVTPPPLRDPASFAAENAERFSRAGRMEPSFRGLLPRAKSAKIEDQLLGPRPIFYILDLALPPFCCAG